MYALIVDDEPIARDMVKFSLEETGFRCVKAKDGAEAMELLKCTSFPLVVADLCMPNTNGQALIRNVLSATIVPLIVVHTAVTDPRVTTMLMTMGVDDILYKPSNYAGFAAKMKIIVGRRTKQQQNFATKTDEDAALPLYDSCPLSSAPIDTFVAAQLDSADNDALAKTVIQNKELTEAVLRLASTYGNGRIGREVGDIKEAIVRLGRKRISEIALQCIDG